MATRKDDIPFPIGGFKSVAGIPNELCGARYVISAERLMNSTNILYEYIDDLCRFVQSKSEQGAGSLSQIVAQSKNMPLFDVRNKSPWTNYRLQSSIWTVYDELVLAAISISLIYNQLTVENIDSHCSVAAKGPIMSDTAWKKSNNLLKQSLKILNAFIPAVADGPNSEELHRTFHLNTALIQLMVVIKNIYTTHNSVDADFGAFDTLPSNVGTYRRILIFVYNEFSKLGSAYSKEKDFLEVLYCYYSALEYYANDKVGVAVGLVRHGLLNAIDFDPIQSKLHINPIKSKLHISGKSKIKEASLFRDKVRLSRKFSKDFPPIYQKTVLVTAQLLKILYIKFDKVNQTLSYETIPRPDEIQQEYLFQASDLPNGLQVPLSGAQTYIPSCLGTSHDLGSVKNYF